MRRHVFLAGTSVLFAAVVLAYAAFAWVETEERVLAAAEAEGRALLQSVAAGIELNLDGSRALERRVSERLFELAERLELELSDEPGHESEVLRRFIGDHALRGAILLDTEGNVRASAAENAETPPLVGTSAFDPERMARLDAERVAAAAREAGLDREARLTLGFGEEPFGTRDEYVVAVRSDQLRGHLVLRDGADDLVAFREEAGVERLLRTAAESPAIDHLGVQAAEGRVLGADDPALVGETLPAAADRPSWRATARGRVLDVALPAPWIGPPAGQLRAGLAAAPVADVISRARRNLVVFTGRALRGGRGALRLPAARERRAAAARRHAEERERFEAMGRLAAGVAHEVRSPLNALSMAAQRLVREAAPQTEPERTRFQELVGALRASVGRLDATVREFLTLGQAGPGPERTRFDVASLVDEVLLAEATPTRREPPPAPVEVVADRGLLAKAIANLVRNAHQVAPADTVVVGWRREPAHVVVEIRDGGPGVAAADRAKVFEPFFTKRPGGTGLGLALARDAVERQGGAIVLDDAPGGGARFAIRLPMGSVP